jgi:hypothetical protein
MGDDLNCEYQEDQILPVPSDVGHYQCEEKCHLIAFLPRFGHPVVEMVQNFIYKEITVEMSSWIALLYHEYLTWENRFETLLFEPQYLSSFMSASELLMLTI